MHTRCGSRLGHSGPALTWSGVSAGTWVAGAVGQQEPRWLGIWSEQAQKHLGGFGIAILLRRVEQMKAAALGRGFGAEQLC